MTLSRSGQNIVNDLGQIIRLVGCTIYDGDLFYNNSRVQADLANIKSWGLNTIQIMCHWSRHIEPDEDQVGVYNESNIAKMEQVIQWAQSEGIYVFLAMRESGSAWTNVPISNAWNYPDMFDPEYRQKAINAGGMPVPAEEWDYYFDRYINAWRYLIRKFNGYDNVIGYNLDFFPWHGQDPFTGDWQSPPHKYVHYETVMIPLLMQMLRAETDKIYFYTPVNQGRFVTPEASAVASAGYSAGETQNDALASTGGYDPDINRNGIGALVPVADNNVVYTSGGHRPRNVEENKSPLVWSETTLQKDFMYASYYPLKKFMNKYNVPGMITEMGLMFFNAPRPTAQWRLDAYDYKMKLLNSLGINWVWWQYHVYNAQSLVDEGNNLNEQGAMLVANIPFIISPTQIVVTRQSTGETALDFQFRPLLIVVSDVSGNIIVTWNYINLFDGVERYISPSIQNIFSGVIGGVESQLELKDVENPDRGEAIAIGVIDFEALNIVDGQWHSFESRVTAIVQSASGASVTVNGVLGPENFKAEGTLSAEILRFNVVKNSFRI